MTTPDYRALCAELVETCKIQNSLIRQRESADDWDNALGIAIHSSKLIDRARALLAAPKVDGPYVKDCCFQGPPQPPYRSASEWFESEGSKGQLRSLRVQAYPAPEAVGVADDELDRWIASQSCVPPSDEIFLDRNVYVYPMSMDELRLLIRAAVARYGTAHPAPVPVGERPWERDGWCDAKGMCWLSEKGTLCDPPAWAFVHKARLIDAASYPSGAESLPHWALPLPGDQ